MQEPTIHKEQDGSVTYYSYSVNLSAHQYWRVGRFRTPEEAIAGFEKMKETGRI